MAEYDGLALNTPTKVRENTDVEVWATRTANGGTVEFRPKAGGTTDLQNQRDARLVAMVATLNAWSATAASTTATSGNVVAVVNGILDNLEVFYARVAELLQSLGKG